MTLLGYDSLNLHNSISSMTPRRSTRADVQRRLRAAAKFMPPLGPLPSPGEGTERTVSAERDAWLPPAPTKLQQISPALTDEVRALYEADVMPVAEIARLAGVTERTLYKYVQRGGWRRRYPVRGVEAAAANRGRKRAPRPPQPKGAGGRFIPREEWGKPHASGLKALDAQGAGRAVAACNVAGAMANEAFSRAVALHDAYTRRVSLRW